jgi:hypothetical protein
MYKTETSKRSQVLTAVKHVDVDLLGFNALWYVYTNISEKHTVSIFSPEDLATVCFPETLLYAYIQVHTALQHRKPTST